MGTCEKLTTIRRLLQEVYALATAIDEDSLEEIYQDEDAKCHISKALAHAEASAEYVIGAIDHDRPGCGAPAPLAMAKPTLRLE